MRILPVYNASKGGWVYKDEGEEVIVKADTVLIGSESKPWMAKIAMVELGICTAREAIAEVVHEYHIKTSSPSTEGRVNGLSNYNIPPELISRGKEPVQYPEDAKVCAELLEQIIKQS
jgi:hypothetical protein